ncbi:Gfo/Idh/MocA family oxidoreductase [Aliishimia ponticola]|uniref:Gfo/Idh/MocA family oxidoreductase n=1 Tax=Aliishimia ponticola TaxID=2499833 RepID=A0A4S4NCY9_9RHOB|nr:Gfo/Idh/MocA family oxidoreductase [Aliishimia ponticola]THH35918.1 Gfo/Idh/MocA family oxidoreductase [Aliishimia ponticola]
MTRILVLGGGLIGKRHVARVIAHPRAVLAGLVDPDPATGADFADMSDVSGPVDGVIIATPTPLHGAHGRAAAARGWPMLIEKPVAATLADVDGLEGAALLVGHHRRHHPRVTALADLLAAGTIGRPVTATLLWAMKKPDSYFAGNWRSAGGSPVMINLVHEFDLLRFWFGEITAIAALPGTSLRAARGAAPRHESGAIALRFEGGLAATVSFSDNAPSPWGFEAATGENPHIGQTGQDMMWVTGTAGAVSFPSLTVWQGTDWSRPAIARAPATVDGPAPLDAQLDHFLEVIAGRAAPICTLADGRAALAAALEVEAQLDRRAA